MIAYKEIEYLIDSFRGKGTIEVVNGNTSDEYPKTAIFDCCATNKLKDLADGTHDWYDARPYFYHGDVNEIANRFKAKEKDTQVNTAMKYPAIILHTPVAKKSVGGYQIKKEIEARLFFVTGANLNDTFNKRYQENIEPIILPLVSKFKRSLKAVDTVEAFDLMEETDIPKYVDSKEVIGIDIWDGVFLRTKILFNQNCKNLKLCQI